MNLSQFLIDNAMPFQLQQPGFRGDSVCGGKPGEMSRGGNHTVAWDENREGITRQGTANSTRCVGLSQFDSDLAVGTQAAEGYLMGDVQHIGAKAAQLAPIQRQIEYYALPGKILVHLFEAGSEEAVFR